MCLYACNIGCRLSVPPSCGKVGELSGFQGFLSCVGRDNFNLWRENRPLGSRERYINDNILLFSYYKIEISILFPTFDTGITLWIRQ